MVQVMYWATLRTNSLKGRQMLKDLVTERVVDDLSAAHLAMFRVRGSRPSGHEAPRRMPAAVSGEVALM